MSLARADEAGCEFAGYQFSVVGSFVLRAIEHEQLTSEN
jgi:hypothetical protein